jgi:hypothetical protein
MSIIGSSLQVDLDNYSAAFPKPFFLKVEKFGSPPDSVTIVDNFTLFFHKITKDSAGTYAVSAANYHLQKKAEQIGVGTSNLTLDVLCKMY